MELLQFLLQESAAIGIHESVAVAVGEPDAGGLGKRFDELGIIGLLWIASYGGWRPRAVSGPVTV